MIKNWSFISLLILLVGCVQTTSPKLSLPAQTLLPSVTVHPIFTPTAVPTLTSTPTRQIISHDNVSQLTEIDRWQTETFFQVIWDDKSTKIFITDFDNVHMYDVTQLNLELISFDEYRQQSPIVSSIELTDKGDCNTSVDQFALNPDKTILATGWSYGHKQPPKTIISLWSMASKKCLMEFPEFDGWLSAISFSPSGNYLVFSTDITYVWNVEKAQQTCKIIGREATFVPGKDVLTIVEIRDWLGYRIGLWDIEKCDLIQKYAIGGLNPVFSPNGELLATNERSHILIIDTKTGQLLKELEGHPYDIGTISFSPDGRFMLSGSYRESTNIGYKSTFILWAINP